MYIRHLGSMGGRRQQLRAWFAVNRELEPGERALSIIPQQAGVFRWKTTCGGNPGAGHHRTHSDGSLHDPHAFHTQSIDVSRRSNAQDAGKALVSGRVQVDRIGSRAGCRRG